MPLFKAMIKQGEALRIWGTDEPAISRYFALYLSLGEKKVNDMEEL